MRHRGASKVLEAPFSRTRGGLIRGFFSVNSDFSDLFGTRASPKRGRGRPAHVPTPENIKKVRRLLAAGCPKVHIARELKITMPTFRLHYFQTKTERKS